jgi:hypothetical protein
MPETAGDAGQDCGHEGITQEECEAKGCCYDESASLWCFYKSKSGGQESADAAPMEDKKEAGGGGECDINQATSADNDCGHEGITQTECEAQGCCYNEHAALWCFKKKSLEPSSSSTTTAAETDEQKEEQNHDPQEEKTEEEQEKKKKKEEKQEEDQEAQEEEEQQEPAQGSDEAKSPPPAPPPAEEAGGEPAKLPTLFCFAVLAGGGEAELIGLQEKTGTGIFACDEWGKFTSNSTVGHEGEPALPSWTLTDTFIAAWKLLKKDGRYKSHDYVVKLDVDTVFFADRLRTWLSQNKPPHNEVYLRSCVDDSNGLASSLEVFSSSAVTKYLDAIDSCREKLEYSRWGEEVFTQKCMESVDVEAWDFQGLVCDNECSCDPSPCEFGKIAYHSLKNPADYEQCTKDARG